MIENGQVYKKPWPICHEVVVFYLAHIGHGSEFGLMYICRHENPKLNCLGFESEKNGRWFWSRGEMEEKIKSGKWELQSKRVEIVEVKEGSCP